MKRYIVKRELGKWIVVMSNRHPDCDREICSCGNDFKLCDPLDPPQEQQSVALQRISDEADRICSCFPVGKSIVASFADEVRTIARSAL